MKVGNLWPRVPVFRFASYELRNKIICSLYVAKRNTGERLVFVGGLYFFGVMKNARFFYSLLGELTGGVISGVIGSLIGGFFVLHSVNVANENNAKIENEREQSLINGILKAIYTEIILIRGIEKLETEKPMEKTIYTEITVIRGMYQSEA